MLKKRLALYPFIFFVWGSSLCFAASNDAVWYIANGAGMILEKAFPLRALRSKNALSMQVISETDLPVELRKYYISPWKIMRSVFYEDGKRIKSQWVFRDESDLALFVASIGNDGAGFIEWYNEQGYIIEEQRLDSDGSGYFISYTYKDNVLLKAESHSVEAIPSEPAEKLPVETKTEAPAAAMLPKPQEEAESEEIAQELLMGNSAAVQKEPVNQTAAAKPPTPAAEKVSAQAKKPQGPASIPAFFVARTGREGSPLWTDTYKYTRTASLRSIERVFHVKENDPETKNIRQTIRFPRLVPKELQEDETNVSTITADSSFLSDIFRNVPAKSVYKTDAKRRVITETRMDGEGGIIGEINNLWNNDRLSVVTWRGKDEERTVEYRYNKAGDRIGEVNYRNGVLERTVELIEGGKELEKLYINNQVILSAIWENGRKLSEERYPIKQVRN